MLETLKKQYRRIQPYIITIMLTIAITSFIIQGASDSTFVENFNFASTITSIILSVIAILITIIDRETSTSILNKTVEATETITLSTQNLNSASIKIDEFVNILKETEDNILKKTQQQYDELIITMTQSNIMERKGDFKNMFNNNDLPNLNSQDDLEKVLYGLSFNTRQYILLIHQSYINKKSIDLLKFNKYIKNEFEIDKLTTYETVDSIATTLDILRGLNLIEFNFDREELKFRVDFVNENFKLAVESVIPGEDCLSDAPDARYFGTVYNFIKSQK